MKTSAELLAAQALASQLRKELTGNILPYWMERMCKEKGEFYGRIDGNDAPDPTAPLGNIKIGRAHV